MERLFHNFGQELCFCYGLVCQLGAKAILLGRSDSFRDIKTLIQLILNKDGSLVFWLDRIFFLIDRTTIRRMIHVPLIWTDEMFFITSLMTITSMRFRGSIAHTSFVNK